MTAAVSAVVLSGKGGTAKTLWQMMLAGEASRAGVHTLLVDADPERNLSNHFGVSQHSTGLGSVLEDACITFWSKPENGAKRLNDEIIDTRWPNVDLLPAGASLTRVGQTAAEDTRLLRDIFDLAGVFNRYQLVLIDTGGRTGSLETLAMHAADVAYAPITPTNDAVRKAVEARVRVERVQKTHPLKWGGVVLSGFDIRNRIDQTIRANVYQQFGESVRAELPRRAVINEVFQLGERLGDRSDPSTSELALIFHKFLLHDVMNHRG